MLSVDLSERSLCLPAVTLCWASKSTAQPTKVDMITPRRRRNSAWVESQESQLPIHPIFLGNPEELHCESKEQGDVNNATVGN